MTTVLLSKLTNFRFNTYINMHDTCLEILKYLGAPDPPRNKLNPEGLHPRPRQRRRREVAEKVQPERRGGLGGSGQSAWSFKASAHSLPCNLHRQTHLPTRNPEPRAHGHYLAASEPQPPRNTNQTLNSKAATRRQRRSNREGTLGLTT